MSLIESAKGHVERLVPELRGDDDFMPFLITRRGDEINYLGIAGMEEQYKDDIAAVMFATMVVGRCEEAVYGSAAWFISGPPNPDGSMPDDLVKLPPGEHPQRIEVAHLIHVTPDGDALHTAKLHRRNNRVLLGAWQEAAAMGGRFTYALQAGLRMAASLPAEWDEMLATEGNRDAAMRGAMGAYHKHHEERRAAHRTDVHGVHPVNTPEEGTTDG